MSSVGDASRALFMCTSLYKTSDAFFRLAQPDLTAQVAILEKSGGPVKASLTPGMA
jgi:hypothetical protein